MKQSSRSLSKSSTARKNMDTNSKRTINEEIGFSTISTNFKTNRLVRI
jgi:hypothetical protein